MVKNLSRRRLLQDKQSADDTSWACLRLDWSSVLVELSIARAPADILQIPVLQLGDWKYCFLHTTHFIADNELNRDDSLTSIAGLRGSREMTY